MNVLLILILIMLKNYFSTSTEESIVSEVNTSSQVLNSNFNNLDNEKLNISDTENYSNAVVNIELPNRTLKLIQELFHRPK